MPPQQRHMAGRTHRNRASDRPTVVPIVSDQQPTAPSAPAASPARSWPSPTSGLRTSCAWKRPQNSTRHHAYGSSSQQRTGKPRRMGQHRQRHQRHPLRRPQRRKTRTALTHRPRCSRTPTCFRTVALMVSSETDIPVNDLGIIMGQPRQRRSHGRSRTQTLPAPPTGKTNASAKASKSILAMASAAQGADEADIRQLRPIWAPTKESSDAARADWYQKVASTNPAFADSDVGLSRAGLTWDEIAAHRAYEKQRSARRTPSTNYAPRSPPPRPTRRRPQPPDSNSLPLSNLSPAQRKKKRAPQRHVGRLSGRARRPHHRSQDDGAQQPLLAMIPPPKPDANWKTTRAKPTLIAQDYYRNVRAAWAEAAGISMPDYKGGAGRWTAPSGRSSAATTTPCTSVRNSPTSSTAEAKPA